MTKFCKKVCPPNRNRDGPIDKLDLRPSFAMRTGPLWRECLVMSDVSNSGAVLIILPELDPLFGKRSML